MTEIENKTKENKFVKILSIYDDNEEDTDNDNEIDNDYEEKEMDFMFETVCQIRNSLIDYVKDKDLTLLEYVDYDKIEHFIFQNFDI